MRVYDAVLDDPDAQPSTYGLRQRAALLAVRDHVLAHARPVVETQDVTEVECECGNLVSLPPGKRLVRPAVTLDDAGVEALVRIYDENEREYHHEMGVRAVATAAAGAAFAAVAGAFALDTDPHNACASASWDSARRALRIEPQTIGGINATDADRQARAAVEIPPMVQEAHATSGAPQAQSGHVGESSPEVSRLQPVAPSVREQVASAMASDASIAAFWQWRNKALENRLHTDIALHLASVTGMRAAAEFVADAVLSHLAQRLTSVEAQRALDDWLVSCAGGAPGWSQFENGLRRVARVVFGEVASVEPDDVIRDLRNELNGTAADLRTMTERAERAETAEVSACVAIAERGRELARTLDMPDAAPWGNLLAVVARAIGERDQFMRERDEARAQRDRMTALVHEARAERDAARELRDRAATIIAEACAVLDVSPTSDTDLALEVQRALRSAPIPPALVRLVEAVREFDSSPGDVEVGRAPSEPEVAAINSIIAAYPAAEAAIAASKAEPHPVPTSRGPMEADPRPTTMLDVVERIGGLQRRIEALEARGGR